MPARILVVDDEPVVLDLLAWGLRHGGYDVVAVGRFEDAKRCIAEQPPDALVTDVRLGPFNGLQIALQLRDAVPGAPIVVLSGFDDPTLRRETEEMGGAYFVKPLPREALLAHLRERLPAA